MATGTSYATEFTSINKLLSSIIGEFPYTVYDPVDKNLNIVKYLEETSKDFCSLVASSKIILGQDKSKQGSFGIVGPIYAKTSKGTTMLYANNISFPNYDGSRARCTTDTCTWFLHEIALLVKASNDPQEIYLRIESSRVQKGIKLYRANDSLNEAIIGGLVSYLYDLGIAPCVPKHFGYYACSGTPDSMTNKPRFNTSIVLEKSSMPILDVLGNMRSLTPRLALKSKRSNRLGMAIFDSMSIKDLIAWSCHIARTLFVMKYHFGIVHFDCHLKNILLTLVTDRFGGQPIDLVYGGMHLNKVRYFNYSLPNGKTLILENNGFVPKIIDYGLTLADFSSSVENSDIKAKILNGDEIRAPGWQKAAEDRNGYGDADFNFFVYCVITQLYKVSHSIGHYGMTDVQKTKAADIYTLYYEFASTVVPNFTLDQTIDSSAPGLEWVANIRKLLNDETMPIFHSRNVGTTADITSPLNGIYKYLSNKGLTTSNGDVYVTQNNIPPDRSAQTLNVGYKSNCQGGHGDYQGCPKESAHIDMVRSILRSCPHDTTTLSSTQKIRCKKLKVNEAATNANNTLFKRLIPIDIKTVSRLWSNNSLMKSPILLSDMQQFIEYRSPKNNCAVARMSVPIVGVTREIILLYMARKDIVPYMDIVDASSSAYELVVNSPASTVSIVGGMPYNKPVGIVYKSGVDVADKIFQKLSSVTEVMVFSRAPNGQMEIEKFNPSEDYSKMRFAFNSPLAIANGQAVFTGITSELQPSRSILGITKSGEVLCIIAQGSNVYNPGLTLDHMAYLGLQFDMVVGVHYGHGFENNIIVKDGDTPKWALSPDMYSNFYGSHAMMLSFVSQ